MAVYWMDHVILERMPKGIVCRRLKERRTYDVLAEGIQSILAEYGIQIKSSSIMTNDARNFSKASEEYGVCDIQKTITPVISITDLLQDHTFTLPPDSRCASHSLNVLTISISDVKIAEFNNSA